MNESKHWTQMTVSEAFLALKNKVMTNRLPEIPELPQSPIRLNVEVDTDILDAWGETATEAARELPKAGKKALKALTTERDRDGKFLDALTDMARSMSLKPPSEDRQLPGVKRVVGLLMAPVRRQIHKHHTRRAIAALEGETVERKRLSLPAASEKVREKVAQLKAVAKETIRVLNQPVEMPKIALPQIRKPPHWHRTQEVFSLLDALAEERPEFDYTYASVIRYVREMTGRGCSSKLITKWKRERNIIEA